MRDELFWIVFGLIATVCGVVHFWIEPLMFTGRVWDGVVGASILGNVFMVVVNAVELRDGVRPSEWRKSLDKVKK